MTSVTRSGALIAASALAAGVLIAVPAHAVPPEQSSDPISGPVGGLLGQPADTQTHRRDRGDYGHTSARDGTLRHGCRNYRYRYVIKTPTNDWTLETFLDDPTGETLGSGAFLSDSDPRRGRAVFRFCRYSTRPGTFAIRAKVQWYDGSTEHKAWFRPSHFRLHRA